ncbi:hypothetical protein ACYOEI_15840, partial [Singulisphaera rosea]
EPRARSPCPAAGTDHPLGEHADGAHPPLSIFPETRFLLQNRVSGTVDVDSPSRAVALGRGPEGASRKNLGGVALTAAETRF